MGGLPVGASNRQTLDWLFKGASVTSATASLGDDAKKKILSAEAGGNYDLLMDEDLWAGMKSKLLKRMLQVTDKQMKALWSDGFVNESEFSVRCKVPADGSWPGVGKRVKGRITELTVYYTPNS